MRPMLPILCLLFVAPLAAGCNRSNDAAITQAKAEAEAVRAELDREKTRADRAEARLATVTADLEKLKAAQQEPAKTAVDDQDRKAAEWVVRVGGVVRVIADGVQSEHPKDGKLPEGPLKVTLVNLVEPGKMNKLTNEGVKHLEGLKSLNVLIMHPVGVDDFSFLKGMESLETFHCEFTDDGLSHLKNLTSIKDLSIGGFFGNPKITDVGLAHLENLKNLERLDLAGVALTDAGLKYIAKHNKLQSLSLFRTPISDAGLQHLKGLTELRRLNLEATQVTGSGLEHLNELPKLTSLSLAGSKVADTTLAQVKGLAQLEELALFQTKITDVSLEHLKGLPKLRVVNLHETMVTSDGVKALKAALPNCSITSNAKN